MQIILHDITLNQKVNIAQFFGFFPFLFSLYYYSLTLLVKIWRYQTRQVFVFTATVRKEKSLPITAAATALLLYTSYKYLTSSSANSSNNINKTKQGIKEIPVPGSKYPYVGHMLSLGDLPAKKISEWHRELGPILKLQMGVHTWILVEDRLLAQKIFVTHGTETSFRPHSIYAYHHYSMEGI